MNKLSFTLSVLLVATTEAFSTHGNMLAQSGSGCCCAAMPCQDACQKPCEHKNRPVPPIMVKFPPPIQEVMLDIDVLVQHIFNEIKPTIPEGTPLPPANDPIAESEYITSVLSPLIMQVMANDIVPVLPVCTFPDGSSFYLNDAPDPNPASTVVDTEELMASVLQTSFESLIENANSDAQRDYLKSLNSGDIME